MTDTPSPLDAIQADVEICLKFAETIRAGEILHSPDDYAPTTPVGVEAAEHQERMAKHITRLLAIARAAEHAVQVAERRYRTREDASVSIGVALQQLGDTLKGTPSASTRVKA